MPHSVYRNKWRNPGKEPSASAKTKRLSTQCDVETLTPQAKEKSMETKRAAEWQEGSKGSHSIREVKGERI